jgi:hypothetical protein
MMLVRRLRHSRMAAATLRRIVALALPRTQPHALRAIAAPGLVAAVPDEHPRHRPSIKV